MDIARQHPGRRPRGHLRRRFAAPAVLVAVAIVAGSCARNEEYDPSAEQVDTGGHRSPTWVLAAQSRFNARQRAATPLQRAKLPPLANTATTTVSTPANGLPPKATFVATLGAAGIGATSAGCMYDSLSTGPLASRAGALISGITSGAAAPDAATIQQLLLSVAPCLDGATLASLLGAAGVSGGLDLSKLGSSGLAGALGGASGAAALQGALSKIDLSQLQRIGGGSLTPQQLTTLASLANGLTTLSKTDLSKLDLSSIDLSKLDPQKAQLLIAAVIAGLTPAQQAQLNAATKIDLAKLNIQVDTSKLTADQASALLLAVAPYIAAGLQPAGSTPPAGQDPDKIYVPPSLDLSAINPLYFVPRDNVVTGLAQQGIDPKFGGCLYDKIRVIDPQTFARALGGNDQLASGQVFLGFLGCILGSN